MKGTNRLTSQISSEMQGSEPPSTHSSMDGVWEGKQSPLRRRTLSTQSQLARPYHTAVDSKFLLDPDQVEQVLVLLGSGLSSLIKQ